ncbi:hypothetical protein T440DRAFT_473343 [Plenodomus tracheiphilus IPT5]|uniref:Uncharacterized protein n=1 Tax=Plenodomus tracheiphilus IPT5 TaxID=1408161 RepID=A0A6A7AMQ8_9PLEO|nr:hypothetical protein T440DRAFT_473343 [Plenodomus tracheiphilus IPT5]
MTGLQSPSLPFPSSKALSNHRLRTFEQQPLTRSSLSSSQKDSDNSINHVPGEPIVDLTGASVRDFLIEELNTPVLDQLYSHLWCVARKSSKSIDPLNKQKVKAREIIATEDASLHLVWHRDRIYVKPMPLCLLNHDFWTAFLPLPVEDIIPNQPASLSPHTPPEPVFDRRIALGFMRSYALLVRHHVDFVLACDAHLFPARFEWTEWSRFIAHFRQLEDEDVAPRYHYGQLRLSRLNWAVRLFHPSFAQTKWFYAIPYWSTGMYLEHSIAPLVFGFASLSLVLSSMQVLLAVPDDDLSWSRVDASSLLAMKRAFWVFSVMMLLLSSLMWALLFAVPTGVLIWQMTWGFQNRGKTDRQDPRSTGQTIVAKV